MVPPSLLTFVKQFHTINYFKDLRTKASLMLLRCVAVVITAVFWLVVGLYFAGCGADTKSEVSFFWSDSFQKKILLGDNLWRQSEIGEAILGRNQGYNKDRVNSKKGQLRTSLKDDDYDKDGFSNAQGDCNDKDSSIYPGATEQCNDGIDQNCDGADATCSFSAREISQT